MSATCAAEREGSTMMSYYGFSSAARYREVYLAADVMSFAVRKRDIVPYFDINFIGFTVMQESMLRNVLSSVRVTR